MEPAAVVGLQGIQARSKCSHGRKIDDRLVVWEREIGAYLLSELVTNEQRVSHQHLGASYSRSELHRWSGAANSTKRGSQPYYASSVLQLVAAVCLLALID